MPAHATGTHERRGTQPSPIYAHESGEEFDEPSPSSSVAGSDHSDLGTHYERRAPGRLADRLTDNIAPQPVNMTVKDYEKALQESQLAVSTLRADIREAKLVNSKLSADKSRRRASRGASRLPSSTYSISHPGPPSNNTTAHLPNGLNVSTFSSSLPKEAAPDSADKELGKFSSLISMLGRKFGIMNELFVSESAFMQPHPGNRVLTALGRYIDDDSMAKGIIAELYIAVPAHLHDLMRHSSFFHRKFLKALGENRRTVIHQLRNETASVIFGHPAVYYKQGYDRSTIPEFAQLLSFPEPVDHPRPRAGPPSKMMPILFPNNRRDASKIFRNESLANLLKSILFGASSLTRGNKKYSGPKPQGIRWGLQEVTPGAIACAAILAIHIHSPDQQLTEIGATSKIPYYKFFAQYKRIIIEGEGTPKIASLYLFYNQIVFKNNSSTSAAKASGETDEDSSGIDDILDNLRMSDGEDTVTEDHGASVPSVNAVAAPNLPSVTGVAGPPGLNAAPLPLQLANNDTDMTQIPIIDAPVPTPLTPLVTPNADANSPNVIGQDNDPAHRQAIQGGIKRGSRKGKAKAIEVPPMDTAAGSYVEPRNSTRRSTRRTQ